jgi:NAD(P)-dependent dehydrogenase (short-subunit alcohol dehydrogenase family)
LLNNAGFIAGERTETAEGLESTFATNHLAPFLLTGHLLPLVQNSRLKRIVNVASRAHKWAKPDMEDLQMTKDYKPLTSYCNSKLYNILHVRKLAMQLKGTEIVCYALHPGAVSTGFGKSSSTFLRLMVGVFRPLMLSPAKGAITPIRLSMPDAVGAPSGTYFEKDKPFTPFTYGSDDRLASELWDKSTGILQQLGVDINGLYKF